MRDISKVRICGSGAEGSRHRGEAAGETDLPCSSAGAPKPHSYARSRARALGPAASQQGGQEGRGGGTPTWARRGTGQGRQGPASPPPRRWRAGAGARTGGSLVRGSPHRSLRQQRRQSRRRQLPASRRRRGPRALPAAASFSCHPPPSARCQGNRAMLRTDAARPPSRVQQGTPALRMAPHPHGRTRTRRLTPRGCGRELTWPPRCSHCRLQTWQAVPVPPPPWAPSLLSLCCLIQGVLGCDAYLQSLYDSLCPFSRCKHNSFSLCPRLPGWPWALSHAPSEITSGFKSNST